MWQIIEICFSHNWAKKKKSALQESLFVFKKECKDLHLRIAQRLGIELLVTWLWI